MSGNDIEDGAKMASLIFNMAAHPIIPKFRDGVEGT
jgi:hypothetical protein